MSKIIRLGICLQILSCVLIIFLGLLSYESPFLIHSLKIPGSIGLAFILCNASPMALDFVYGYYGIGSALISFVQMLFAAFLSYFVMQFYNETALPLYTISLLLALLAFFIQHSARKLCGVRQLPQSP